MRATASFTTRAAFLLMLAAAMPQHAFAGQALEDITAQVRVKAGGFRFDRHTGQYVQAVTIENHAGKMIGGRLYARLDSLARGVALANGQVGSNAVVDIPTKRQGQMFAGEVTTSVLRFHNPDNKPIRYQMRIMRAPSE